MGFFHFFCFRFDECSEFCRRSFEQREQFRARFVAIFHLRQAIDASGIDDFTGDEAARDDEVRIRFGEIDGNASRSDGVVEFECDGDGTMEFFANGLENRTDEGFLRKRIFDDAERHAFSTEFRANFIDRIDRNGARIG